MFEAGKYRGVLTRTSLTESKGDKKTPQIAFEVEVREKYDATDKEFYGVENPTKRTVYRFLTPNAAKYAVEDLQKLGFKGDDFASLDEEAAKELGVEFIDLSGVEVPLLCEIEAYQGKDRERWSFGFGGGGGAPSASRDVVNKVRTDLNGLLAANKPAAPTKPKQKPAQTTTKKTAAASVPVEEQDPDDVPF